MIYTSSAIAQNRQELIQVEDTTFKTKVNTQNHHDHADHNCGGKLHTLSTLRALYSVHITVSLCTGSLL